MVFNVFFVREHLCGGLEIAYSERRLIVDGATDNGIFNDRFDFYVLSKKQKKKKKCLFKFVSI